MKIMYISRSMKHGGAQKVVLQLCTDFASNNEIIVLSSGGYYVKELEKIGVRHIAIPDIASRNLIDVVKCIYTIFDCARKNRIDIIHSHHRSAALYSRIAQSFYRKARLVYTSHNVFFDKKRLTRYALSNASIVAVGYGVKKNMESIYGIQGERILVITNAVACEEEKAEDKSPILVDLQERNYILIGFIGRLSVEKRCDLFIKALSDAYRTNRYIKGVIIGNGEENEKLRKQVETLFMQQNIIFLGYQNHVSTLMRQLDFVVLPSQKEGFPLTPIEAFSVGKTIIASNIDGNNEIIKDGVNGLLFENGDSDDLTEKILLLVNDTSYRKNLSLRAREDYENKYAYKIFIDKYRVLYDKVAEE